MARREQQLEFAPRGFFNIGRRNVGGRNRTVDLYTRVSLRPQEAPTTRTGTSSGVGFIEYRIVGTMRAAARARSPATWWSPPRLEQGVRDRASISRARASTPTCCGGSRRRSGSRGRYSFSTTRTFDERLDEEEQATIDRIFPQVRLSTFSGALTRDTRDNVIDPRKGGS